MTHLKRTCHVCGETWTARKGDRKDICPECEQYARSLEHTTQETLIADRYDDGSWEICLWSPGTPSPDHVEPILHLTYGLDSDKQPFTSVCKNEYIWGPGKITYTNTIAEARRLFLQRSNLPRAIVLKHEQRIRSVKTPYE